MPVFYSEGLDGRKQQKMPMQDPARVVVLAFAKFSGISCAVGMLACCGSRPRFRVFSLAKICSPWRKY